MIRIWTIHGPLSACYRVNYNSDDIVTWTISALFMFGGIIGIPGDVLFLLLLRPNPSQFHHPGRLSVTLPSHMNQSQGQPLTLSYFNACRLRALRGHQGCHHPPASCLGRGRVQKSGRPCVCLLLAYPASLPSIPAHLHTYQRYVARCSQSFHRHDRGPTRFTISFRSSKLPFSILLSHLHRHPCLKVDRWGVLEVKKGKRKASALQD